MGMGRKRQRQESLWVASQELPRTKGRVFDDRVNRFSTNSSELVADKGYHSNERLRDLRELGIRTISEPDRGRPPVVLTKQSAA
jgi:hypothetical protein